RYFDAPSLNKPGVGLVLDAGRRVTLAKLVVTTDTPGYRAQIRAGDSLEALRDVSASQDVATQTTFDLSDATARYFVVWITQVVPGSGVAHVNEVAAAS